MADTNWSLISSIPFFYSDLSLTFSNLYFILIKHNLWFEALTLGKSLWTQKLKTKFFLFASVSSFIIILFEIKHNSSALSLSIVIYSCSPLLQFSGTISTTVGHGYCEYGEVAMAVVVVRFDVVHCTVIWGFFFCVCGCRSKANRQLDRTHP